MNYKVIGHTNDILFYQFHINIVGTILGGNLSTNSVLRYNYNPYKICLEFLKIYQYLFLFIYEKF